MRPARRSAVFIVGALAGVVGAATAVPVARAAPHPAMPLQWRVVTLQPPAGGGPYSYAEPGIASAGRLAIADAATANSGDKPAFWISRDYGDSWSAGKDFDVSGASTGDADVAIGADHYLYALNLGYNPSPPGQPANPTVLVSRSPDGRTWLGPATFSLPHGLDQPDRPWLVTDPRHPANVDVVNSEVGGNIVMWRSHDHAASFSGPVPVTGGANSQGALTLSSRPLFDPTDDRRMFMLFETATTGGVVSTTTSGQVYEFPMTQIWLAESADAGLSWSSHQILDTTSASAPAVRGGTVGHLLVASAIDGAGNLYAAFSLRPLGRTETSLYLIHSADAGKAWSAPVRVPAPTRSNVMPALAVTSRGTAYLSWYGSAAADFRDAGASWVEMFAESTDPMSPRPSFVSSRLSGPRAVHVGGIDSAGAIGSDLGDNWGLRDFQSIAVDGCGRPHPVWAVDNGAFATQTAIPRLSCE